MTMKLINIHSLSGKALDWAVGKSLGFAMTIWSSPDEPIITKQGGSVANEWCPTQSFAQLCPYMEQLGIAVEPSGGLEWTGAFLDPEKMCWIPVMGIGMAEAGARAIVFACSGKDVAVPEELLDAEQLEQAKDVSFAEASWQDKEVVDAIVGAMS